MIPWWGWVLMSPVAYFLVGLLYGLFAAATWKSSVAPEMGLIILAWPVVWLMLIGKGIYRAWMGLLSALTGIALSRQEDKRPAPTKRRFDGIMQGIRGNAR